MNGMATLALMGDRLVIDTHSPVPSYRQLADQLRDRITSGQIGPREPLPSIQQMVQETGLAVGTVRKAVALLVDEGHAHTVLGRGIYAGKG
jgi:DNA-binding GntR family transcriptional regulator